MKNNDTLKGYLSWHYDPNDKPKTDADCFIMLDDSIQMAYWRDDAKAWDNTYYGWLPEQWQEEVKAWAYVPDIIMNYASPLCGCYIIQDGGRCMGTKEIDLCNCKGIRSKCDFY